MKNSAFAPSCPGCGRKLSRYMFDPSRFDEPWACIACEGLVCPTCYVKHTADCCSDLHVVGSIRQPYEVVFGTGTCAPSDAPYETLLLGKKPAP